jgi:hypothetical protein
MYIYTCIYLYILAVFIVFGLHFETFFYFFGMFFCICIGTPLAGGIGAVGTPPRPSEGGFYTDEVVPEPKHVSRP